MSICFIKFSSSRVVPAPFIIIFIFSFYMRVYEIFVVLKRVLEIENTFLPVNK